MADRAQVLAAMNAAIDAGDKELAETYRGILVKMAGGPQQAEPLEDKGTADAIVTGLGQGATFGFSDEIMAGIRASLGAFGEDTLGSFSERYGVALDDQREGIDAAREHHPWATGISEFVPGLAFGGAGVARGVGGALARQGMKQAGQQGLRSSMGKMAKIGAGYGGLSGAGYSEADSLGGVAADTAIGAGLGAGVGMALPAVGSGIKRGAQNIGRRFRPGAGGSRAQGAAEEAARRQIVKDLKRDGLTVKEAQEVIARNEHYLLADVGQKNMGDLVEDIAQNPGAGRIRMEETLQNRATSSIDRARPVIKEGIENSPLTSDGLKIPGVYSEIEKAIQQHAETLAKPLWATAYSGNAVFKATPWMKRLVAREPTKADGSLGKISNDRVRAADKKA
ncbi:MAG: hypothetical protein ACTSWM_00180, partial [Alphaproteobacteria bacterium]